jgi:2-polyprenyl-3-methyl-5-hydroxy-6-metoxy-1,4-benzoquinol methylase
MDNYFSKHYAHMNLIQADSEESIKDWYEKVLSGSRRDVLPYLGEYTNCKILELGCGIGGILHVLQSLGITDFLGVDRSQEQLSVCRKYVTTNVVHDDALHFLSRQRKKFDIIVMFDLIEHVEKRNIPALLRHIHQSLSIGGRVIIRTPNMGSFFSSHMRYIDFTHTTGFTEESIAQVVRESGFSNVEVLNGPIGRKRRFLLGSLIRFIGYLLNTRVPQVITPNLMVIAYK